MRNIKPIIILFLAVLTFLAGCSQRKIIPGMSSEEMIKVAMEAFDDEDYLEAKRHFQIISLNHSNSNVADKAQYYLAECHFYLKEYILAASEYERLMKIYPSSDYNDDSKFKIGLSYYKLSPKFSLDQDYTYQSIQHFQEFLEDYFISPLVPEVEKMLLEARSKLALKKYDSADQYRKMGYYHAAIIYFTKVLAEYYDSEYAPKAQYWIGECHRKASEFDESQAAFEKYMLKYPKHEWVIQARDKLVQLEKDREKAAKQAEAIDANEESLENL